MKEYSEKKHVASRVIFQQKKNSPCHQTISIWDIFSQKKPIQCKYQWSSNGDDGALIGDKYVIKLSGYNSSAEIYDKKARGLGLITPDSQIITSKSRLWKETVEVALKDVRYRWRNGEKISGIDTALLMKKINGQELTNISLDKIPKDKSVQNIFQNIGKILVLDLYMRNYDRFGLEKYKNQLGNSEYDDPGDGKWMPWSMNEENLFINIDTGKAIPIDSGSYFRGINKKKYRIYAYKLLENNKEDIITDIINNSYFKKMFTINNKKGKEVILKNKKIIAKNNLEIGINTAIEKLFLKK